MKNRGGAMRNKQCVWWAELTSHREELLTKPGMVLALSMSWWECVWVGKSQDVKCMY